jgi:hypothetical protein
VQVAGGATAAGAHLLLESRLATPELMCSRAREGASMIWSHYYSVLYGPPFSSRLQLVAGLQHVEGRFYYTTLWIRLHHLLHSTGRRPAAGSGPLQGCSARGARRLRHHHLLHSTGRRPAAGPGPLQGCTGSTWGARQLRHHHLLHSSSHTFGPQFGSRLLPVAGLRRAGGSRAPTTPSSALCGQQSSSRLCGGPPASTIPSSALYGRQSGILLM